jgi:hypothetical protein
MSDFTENQGHERYMDPWSDARIHRHKRRPDMTEVSRSSAQIFQFPLRGRYAIVGGEAAYRQQAANFAPRVAIAALSGAWYHDEAVRESELQPRKN